MNGSYLGHLFNTAAAAISGGSLEHGENPQPRLFRQPLRQLGDHSRAFKSIDPIW
jgi:hypothetical protein